jgi:hypothetical protein
VSNAGGINYIFGAATTQRAGQPKNSNFFQAETRNFCLLHKFQNGSTQPPIQRVTGQLSLGVKHIVYEAYHSPPFTGEVKKEWSYISPPYTPSWRVKRRLKFYSAY